MNRRTRPTWTSLAALLVGVSLAFAGGAGEQPSGEPPFGVAIQSDAQGTKLTGIGSMEFYNIDTRNPAVAIPADVRVHVRLRQGNRVDTVFTEVTATEGVDLRRVAATQALIVDRLTPEILAKFFGGDPSLGVKVKALEEFLTTETFNSFAGQNTRMVLFDVVLAVK
jgi:hypothetical protein